METLKLILTIVYIIVCIAIVVIVMVQDTSGQGLAAALSGSSGNGTYWSKNKGRSKEGKLNKFTVLLAIIFIILSILLSMKSFQ